MCYQSTAHNTSMFTIPANLCCFISKDRQICNTGESLVSLYFTLSLNHYSLWMKMCPSCLLWYYTLNYNYMCNVTIGLIEFWQCLLDNSNSHLSCWASKDGHTYSLYPNPATDSLRWQGGKDNASGMNSLVSGFIYLKSGRMSMCFLVASHV